MLAGQARRSMILPFFRAASNGAKQPADHLLYTAGCLVEIDLLMKGVAREKKLLGRGQRLLFQTEGRRSRGISLSFVWRIEIDVGDANIFDQPFLSGLLTW
jgi:hypothetical protein